MASEPEPPASPAAQAVTDENNQLRSDLAALRVELAKWKVCADCDTPLEYPGHCGAAADEHKIGLELMLDDMMAERDTLQAALVRRDTPKLDKAE